MQRLNQKKNIGDQTNSLKYFLSPTNVFSNSFSDLHPIDNTDSLIGLDNLNNLNLITYNMETNKFRSASNDWLTFESFEIKKNIVVAFEKSKNTLEKDMSRCKVICEKNSDDHESERLKITCAKIKMQ